MQETTKPTKEATLQEYRFIERYATSIIREARKHNKVSLKNLEECTGLCQQQLNKIENGTNRLRAATLYQMACRLEIPIFYCFPPQFTNPDNSLHQAQWMKDMAYSGDLGLKRLNHALIIHKVINVLSAIEKLDVLESAYKHAQKLYEESWK